MNGTFKKIIDTDSGNKEFDFQVSFGTDGIIYIIDTTDEDNKQIQFQMKKDENGRWKILPRRLPDWVWNSELELNDAIEENAV